MQKNFKLSLDKGNKLKESHGGVPRKKNIVCMKEGRGKRRMKCEKVVSSCVWKCSCKGYEKMKYGMELCVASNRSEASELWFN